MKSRPVRWEGLADFRVGEHAACRRVGCEKDAAFVDGEHAFAEALEERGDERALIRGVAYGEAQLHLGHDRSR